MNADTLFDRLDTHRLRNATHVEFHGDFSALLLKYGPGSMGVKALSDDHTARLAEEKATFEVIRKSELTGHIEIKDHIRDDIGRGAAAYVDANTHHFDADTRASAQSLKIVFDHYKNMSTRSYDDQAALTSDLIAELSKPAHFTQVTALGLAPWITKLSEANTAVIELLRARDAEISERPSKAMKEVRVPVDKVYHDILKRLEAIVLIGAIDTTPILALAKEWNATVARHKHLLAQERGRRHAAANKEEEEGSSEGSDE
jgi:hypothetical protein